MATSESKCSRRSNTSIQLNQVPGGAKEEVTNHDPLRVEVQYGNRAWLEIMELKVGKEVVNMPLTDRQELSRPSQAFFQRNIKFIIGWDTLNQAKLTSKAVRIIRFQTSPIVSSCRPNAI